MTGSLVRITHNESGFMVGTRCIVERDDGDGSPKLREIDGVKDWHYVADTDFEVIDKYYGDTVPKPDVKPHSIPAGTKVRMLEDTWFKKGDVCELVAGAETASCPKLMRLSDGQTYYIQRIHFEIINDKEDNDIMSDHIGNPVVTLRDIDLDDDTKILRKYEFEDNAGRRMSNATEALLNQLWKEQRAAFAKRLRDLEDAEKPATPSTPAV